MDFQLDFDPRKLPDLKALDQTIESFEKAHAPDPDLLFIRKLLITHLEVYFWDHGRYPTLVELQDEFPHIENETLIGTLDDSSFSESLNNRGLPSFNCSGSPISALSKFDPEAILAANLILDVSDKRSTAAKLKSLGLTTRHWRAFLRNRAFKEWFQEQVNSMFVEDVSTRAKISIATLVEANDLNAIKYFHEYTGEFNPRPSVEIVQDPNTLNLTLILAKMMEILAKTLDPETLTSVADELEGVMRPKAIEVGETNGT